MIQNGKKLVVIIPGSNTKMSRFGFVTTILKRAYAHYGVSVENDDAWLAELSTVLEDEHTDTLVFRWSGGISSWSLRKASQDLKRTLLQKQGEYATITLFAKSLGGIVAEKAARDSRLRIQKLIYVATPHFKFKNLPTTVSEYINIYSSADTYQQLGSRILYAGCGTATVADAKNVHIPNLTHGAFNVNNKVQYRDSQVPLFQLYRTLIHNEPS